MSTAGTPLPDEGELRLGTVRLPAGRLLRSKGGDGEPVAWITEAPVPEPGPVWAELSALHRQTGLVPILDPAHVRDFNIQRACQDTATVADVDRADVAMILEEQWADRWEYDDSSEIAEPFTSQYPGLAPAVDTALPTDEMEAALRSFRASRIALVPADRPADVLPVLGWCPGSWESVFYAVDTPVAMAAVLRSWEERFGARVFAMSYDRAHLLVERPPGDLDAALPVAAEHWLFCDDPAGRQAVRTTAANLIGNPIWYFWWD